MKKVLFAIAIVASMGFAQGASFATESHKVEKVELHAISTNAP